MPIMGMDYICGLPSSDAMRIDDLLDFSEQDELFDAAATLPDNHNLPLHDVSSAAYDSSAPPMGTFSDDLYIPSEEAAELEWLSKFVDDSFSEIPIPSWNVPFPSSNSNIGASDDTVLPSRARSKRTKAAAPAALQQAVPSSSATSSSSSSSSSEFPSSVNPKFSSFPGSKKKEVKSEDGVRKCTHCASEKTPQWRTGPLGPKTLCNACGVRFKSGRLVPEYRPAASPTFILTQHSNSHRKVLELRRQKDLVRQPSSSELHYRDYEVC